MADGGSDSGHWCGFAGCGRFCFPRLGWPLTLAPAPVGCDFSLSLSLRLLSLSLLTPRPALVTLAAWLSVHRALALVFVTCWNRC